MSLVPGNVVAKVPALLTFLTTGKLSDDVMDMFEEEQVGHNGISNR